MKESVLYDIFEICRDYHNAKMTAKDSSIFTDGYRDKILGKILGKICDLYGLDLGEIESILRDCEDEDDEDDEDDDFDIREYLEQQ